MLLLHLSLIVSFSLEDLPTRSLGGDDAFSKSTKSRLNKVKRFVSNISEKELAISNPVRQALTLYSNSTGIETGYSYFAPTVPGNAKVVFELYYRDGRVEYDVPVVNEAAAGHRISALLDRLQYVHYARLREGLLQSLATSMHKEHPTAVKIRAVVGVSELITPGEYRSGKKLSYQPSYIYDFRYGNDVPATGH